MARIARLGLLQNATSARMGMIAAWLCATFLAHGGETGSPAALARLQQVVDANIAGIHAYQCGLAVAKTNNDPAWNACGLTTNELAALVQHQYGLLAEKPQSIKAWVEGDTTTFDPAKDMDPLLRTPLKASATNLPLQVFSSFLAGRTHASTLRVRALASVLQMQMDVGRDANRLQDLFALYVTLGLPVHTAQLGLLASTDEEFLTLGKELAPRLCASPFETSPATVQIMLRKMWNWGHRHTGERDRFVMARELLQEPDMAALAPKLKALPPQKIAVIGHSYTMNVHWSSASTFVPVVATLLGEVNPAVEVRQWQAGGMTAESPECQKFYEEVLAWKPDRVLLVLSLQKPGDKVALEKMVTGFQTAGVKVSMFDTLHGSLPTLRNQDFSKQVVREVAEKTGMSLIAVGGRIDAAPDRAGFVALDRVHMTEPYHRLMAKAWLEYLASFATDTNKVHSVAASKPDGSTR